MTRDSVDALVRSYLGAFGSGDPAAVAGHVTEDFVNDHTAALGSGCVGREEYLRRLPNFLATFAGLRYEVEHVVVDGDRAAASYRLLATHEGHPVDIRGVMMFDVRDEAIAKRTDYWDSLVFLRQVGEA